MYKEFHTSQEAHDWGMHYFGEWIRDLQLSKDKAANNVACLLSGYAGNMNTIYNRYLRGFADFDEEEIEKYSKDIAIIADELRKFSLQEDIIVYRYTNKTLFRLLFDSSRPKIGKEFIDKGFMSTTLVRDLLKDFAQKRHYNCVLKLYLPKGTKGAYIKCDDSFLDEQEFLLPPNSKFKLIRKYFNMNFFTVYECELVNQ